jgi:DNA segregation ATPase FtsK/SpoIIIE, S-DNA-T family
MEKEKILMDEAIAYAKSVGTITRFIIQRRFRVGYTRAGRMMAEMESKGILDASTGIVKRKN